MAVYLVKVIASELVTVEADSADDAIEKAGENFGENIEIDDCEIIESSK